MKSSLRQSNPPELSLREENDRYLCEARLSWFLKRFWDLIEPEPLEHNWHIDCFADHAQAVSEGHIQRLLVNAPPRSAKSRPLSIFWQVWDWIRRPKLHWLMIAKTGRLTEEFADSARRLIRDPLFQKYWGHSLPLIDLKDPRGLPLESGERTKSGLWVAQGSIENFDNNYGGKRLSLSCKSDIVGSGGHRIVFDDPHNPQDSLEQLEDIVNWFRKTLRFRMSNRKTGKEVVLAQRVAPTDLSGWILANERDLWEHVMIPMRFDVRRRCVTSIGWSDPRTKQGDLMDPVRTPPEVEQILRDASGDQAPGQLDQDPVPPGGLMFKRDGLGIPFDRLVAEDCDLIFSSLDAAFEGEESSDFCACYLMAKQKANYYILAQMYGQMTFPELGEAYFDFTDLWQMRLTDLLKGNVVEKKANGHALLQTYGSSIEKLLPYVPKTSKLKRFHSAATHFKAKQVFFPHQGSILVVRGKEFQLDASWVASCIGELISIPKAANDDRADAIAQGLLWGEDPENWIPEDAGDVVEPEIDPFADFERPGRMYRR